MTPEVKALLEELHDYLSELYEENWPIPTSEPERFAEAKILYERIQAILDK